jgi:hypothetical protein
MGKPSQEGVLHGGGDGGGRLRMVRVLEVLQLQKDLLDYWPGAGPSFEGTVVGGW